MKTKYLTPLEIRETKILSHLCPKVVKQITITSAKIKQKKKNPVIILTKSSAHTLMEGM